MRAYDVVRQALADAAAGEAAASDDGAVERVLDKERITRGDFPTLLSARAGQYLEPMARTAALLTRRHFGNVIFLFTPLYLSNYCDNRCPYCSFASHQDIARRQLTFDEIRIEAGRIARNGIRHVLALTGESRNTSSYRYVKESIGIVHQSFSSIGIEMYPMTQEEYRGLVDTGVDALTIYQEVYDEGRYRELHQGGPKEDYLFRLEAVERACRAGVRSVTIGALLGLNGWVREMSALAAHAAYIQDTWPDVEVSVSFPRIRPLSGDFTIPAPVDERSLVQIITAFRIMFPHMGITLSTRESAKFRDGAAALGVTRMSAGVSTSVGGHSHEGESPQFEIADSRSVDQVRAALLARGFQPVMHDWNSRYVAENDIG
jgi:2-iminoacetate synthase